MSLAIVTETLYIYRNLLGFETFPSIILPTIPGGRQISYHYFQFSEPVWVKRSYIAFPYMHTLKMAQCRLGPWFSSYNSLSTTPWSASGLCFYATLLASCSKSVLADPWLEVYVGECWIKCGQKGFNLACWTTVWCWCSLGLKGFKADFLAWDFITPQRISLTNIWLCLSPNGQWL